MSSGDRKPVLYLIDGSSYIFRAYHAIQHLSTRTGEPTNAVYGFVNMLLKTLREGDPTHVAVAFDTRGKTFRHERYPAYKANREAPPEDLVQQIPRVHEVVEAMDLPVVMKEGYEADDLIGTLALRALDEGFEVVIVTGDKDFMQLVRPGLSMYDGMRDRWIREDEVREKFGVPPERVTDAMALIGDSSDNVPGVRGIGEKSAGPLIERFGSLEGLYEHLDEVGSAAQKKKLEANADMAKLSKELVTIRTDAPVGVDPKDLARREPDTDRLRELFSELEFTRLVADLAPRAALSKESYSGVTTEAALAEMIEALRAAKVFAYDTETTAIDPMRAELVGLSFAIDGGRAWYVPVGHRYLGAPRQLDRARVLDAVRPLLEDRGRAKYAQHAKYDYLVMKRAGVVVDGITGDPLLFDYLLDPGKTRHGLDTLAEGELGHTNISFSDVAGKGKTQKTFDEVPVEDAIPYACEDADVTWRLAERLAPRVKDAGLWKLFEEVEQPLSTVLAEMEYAGVRVDTGRLAEMSAELEKRISSLEAKIYELAGRRFTIHSTKQLGEILFGELALPIVKRTKTGPSTDVKVLEILADQHPLPRAILDYRHSAKLKSTYVDALPALVNPDTGRIHTSFSQTTAATGRLSSSDPNLQNIPVRTDDGRRIREAFIADPGQVLISLDYSQIELRILAHLSKDAAFAEAFRKGQDIHARTASEIFGVPEDAVGPDQRRVAKAINFGIVYGMSAFRLARDLGIERREAQAFIDGYFARHQGVSAWLERTVVEAREAGMVKTLLGRRRLLPDLGSRNKNVASGAERIAVNTPIQGTAADVIKLAMLRVHEGLPKVCAEATMILQVHDELLVEAPEADAERVAGWVRTQMEEALPLDVPLVVDLGIGANWALAH